MSLAKFSVNQAVLVNLLFGVFILAGVAVYQLLPVDVYPDLSLDEAFVQTLYPGASPEIVEQHVTHKIEEELEDIPGVARMASYSVPNVSHIFVKFREDLDRADYEASYQEVRNRLDRVTDLPAAVEEPLLTRLTLGEVWPIVQVVVYDETGSASERMIHEVALDLKDKLRDLPGIAKIKEVGLRDREIHILVDKHALEQYGLSLQEVAFILENSNQNIPGGSMQTAGEELTLLAEGDALTPAALGDICIRKSPSGAHVYLQDIAVIKEEFQRELIKPRFMGRPCAFLYVAKTRDADSITVRDRVADLLESYQVKTLPPGLRTSLFADSTRMIASRLGVLRKNLSLGLVLVFVVLWMIVGARNSILAIVGIPFSFLCAFIFMYLIHVSINAVSVFALVLVSGMIVDDAIVVLENIYRHLQAGKPLRQSIVDGTDQVMWPVVSAALTTIAAFLPLLIMTGVVGRFFAIIPKTVTVALLASLFECLIILPCHFLHWGPRSEQAIDPHSHGSIFAPLRRLEAVFRRWYRALLVQVLGYRYLFLGVASMLAVCAYQAQRSLDVELFPSDFPTLVATFNVHSEANLDHTDEICQQMIALLGPFVEEGSVKNFSSAIGAQWNEDNQMSQRSNLAQVWIELQQAGGATADPEIIMQRIRQRFGEFVHNHPQHSIENLKIWPIQDGPPVGKPVSIRIEHPDYAVANDIADAIKGRLSRFAGVFDISDNLNIGQRELRMVLKEQEASEFGLTFRDVFGTLNGANEGFIVGTFNDRRYDEDLDIRLRYQEKFRAHPADLLDVDIKSPVTQALIKMRQVADLHYAQGYANHYRFNGNRAVLVTADLDKRLVDAERVNQALAGEFGPLADEDDQLKIVLEGQFKETHESFASLRSAALLAISLMYLVLSAQFKSYVQPLIVLTSLAFGSIGIIMGLVVNDYPFSVVTGIAMVGLFGVMVNDAIVLVSFINERRRECDSVMEALIEASLTRARPILLTTATTVFGLLPMAIGVGGYSKIWSPFATCICWGLTSATMLILLLLPAIYIIVEDLKVLLAALRGGRLFSKLVPPRMPSH